jgi:membrane protein implicated in regulation of membrane protease activity
MLSLDPSTWWLVLFVALALVEIVTSGVVFAFLSLGALVAALALHFGLIQTQVGALATALAIAVISGFALWRPLRDWYRKGSTDNVDPILNQTAIATDDLTPGKQGTARKDGADLPARLDRSVTGTVASGTTLRVIGIDGNVLIVVPAT